MNFDSNVPMSGAHQSRWRCSIQVVVPWSAYPLSYFLFEHLWATTPLLSYAMSVLKFSLRLEPSPSSASPSLSYPSLSFTYEYFFSWPTFLWATVPRSRATLLGTIWCVSSAGCLFAKLFLFSCLIQPFGQHASMAFHIGRARATTIWQPCSGRDNWFCHCLIYTSHHKPARQQYPLCRCRSVLTYLPLVKANRKPLMPDCQQKAHAAPATLTQVLFLAMRRPSNTNPTSHKAESSQPFRTSKHTCSLQKCAKLDDCLTHLFSMALI